MGLKPHAPEKSAVAMPLAEREWWFGGLFYKSHSDGRYGLRWVLTQCKGFGWLSTQCNVFWASTQCI